MWAFISPSIRNMRAVQITRAPPAAASHIFDQKWGIHVGGFDLRFTHDCVRAPSFILVLTTPFAACVVLFRRC